MIADKEIYKELAEEFKSYGVYFANKKEKAMLEEFIFGVTAIVPAAAERNSILR